MPAKPKTIDDYLARVSATQRAALEKLRRDIKAAAPAAEEVYQLRHPRSNDIATSTRARVGKVAA
jgi:uncharacterized protein YdhG (YjbR/CyaY superfamily)